MLLFFFILLFCFFFSSESFALRRLEEENGRVSDVEKKIIELKQDLRAVTEAIETNLQETEGGSEVGERKGRETPEELAQGK